MGVRFLFPAIKFNNGIIDYNFDDIFVLKSEADEYEKKLKYNLYLTGDEMKDEDKKAYETLKDAEVDKEKYPNAEQKYRFELVESEEK